MARRFHLRPVPRLLSLFSALVILARCGGSPSGPSTTTTTTTSSAPAVTTVNITAPTAQSTPGQTTQLTANATFSNGTNQDVTTQAMWESSNNSIATVSSGGLVTAVAAGEVDIRATFRSVTGTTRLTVGSAPKPRHKLSGTLTDQINGRGVDEARVEIVTGINAGRSVTTSTDGTYEFADLIEDSLMVRFSSPFYQTAERPVTLTADVRVDVVMKPSTDVTAFYGTYNVTLSVKQQTCEFPVIPGPPATLTLSGSRDGTTFTAAILDRGNTRTYRGRIGTDGSFGGDGSGVILGIRAVFERSPGGPYSHDFSGSIDGRVSGRSISGTENVVFGAPCPGKIAQIGFSGSK